MDHGLIPFAQLDLCFDTRDLFGRNNTGRLSFVRNSVARRDEVDAFTPFDNSDQSSSCAGDGCRRTPLVPGDLLDSANPSCDGSVLESTALGALSAAAFF